MKKLFATLLILIGLAACTVTDDLTEPPVPLGNFALGHNIVVAPNLTKGPTSRNATAEEWTAAMKKAVGDRFNRYEGDKLYHLGISVEGYVLARRGVPMVYSPKSVLILNVTLWDDAAGTKLNAEPKQVQVIENLTAGPLVGSGYTQTREEQIEHMSKIAAKHIQNWLVENKQWFE